MNLNQKLGRVRNYFNTRAAEDQWQMLSSEDSQLLCEAIQAAALSPGGMVAEPGAGAGRATRQLAQAVAPSGFVFALDIAEQMMARLRSLNLECVVCTEAPVERMPLQAESMDAVFCYNCFHWFACPHLALSEIRRVLKPGGRLVIVHSEPMEKAYSPAPAFDSPGRRGLQTPADLGLLLVRRGFQLTKAPRREGQVLLAAEKGA